MVYFITGEPGTGKTTLAQKLLDNLPRAAWLDGDIFRRTISRDLGYTMEDRAENMRRVFSITRMLVLQGRNVVISMVAPVREERMQFREHFQSYMEIRLTKILERRPDHCYEFEYQPSEYAVIEGDAQSVTDLLLPDSPPQEYVI